MTLNYVLWVIVRVEAKTKTGLRAKRMIMPNTEEEVNVWAFDASTFALHTVSRSLWPKPVNYGTDSTQTSPIGPISNPHGNTERVRF